MNVAAQNDKQYFTAEEANRMLPLVRAIVADIVKIGDVRERQQRLNRIRRERGAETRSEDNLYRQELEQIEEEIAKDVERLRDFFEELAQLGVELKDISLGLVDFPTLIDGREACLCWKLGEDEVMFWHEVDAGFGGRQSLLESSVPGDED